MMNGMKCQLKKGLRMPKIPIATIFIYTKEKLIGWKSLLCKEIR